MKQIFPIISLLFVFITKSTIVLATDMPFFMPEEIKKINPGIPSPEEYFGFEIGQQFLSYDQTTAYLREIARKSDRIKLIQHGYSYQKRPLIFLLISTKENLADLDLIKDRHMDLCNPEKSSHIQNDSLKLISWLCYGIHGNEASSIHAAVIVAYMLAASEDQIVEEMLENQIIILQSGLNPDGVQKYASWVNSTMSYSKNSDKNNQQFHERGASSRFNHYWFDLNRDWLFVQHPESYYRMDMYYEWLPTVLNDYHERENTNGSFFSPGIKRDTNHLIPDKNWYVTEKIGNYHATFLNRIGTLYFTKENYDDFYTGKGATLTDLTGGIGILYEQPNTKGFIRKVDNVEIRFIDMIQNQVYCSFSVLLAAHQMKDDLLNYQRSFFIEQKKQAEKDPVKGYVFGSKSDISTSKELFRILKTHQIKVYKLNKAIKIGRNTFEKDYAYVVPSNQQYYSVIKTIFEKTTNYKDSMIFYDVSTWTIPLGLNIDYAELTDVKGLIGELTDTVVTLFPVAVPQTHYAYLFELTDYYAYRFLYYLQDKGLNLKVADTSFRFIVNGSEKQFGAGTILIPVKEQLVCPERVNQLINAYPQLTEIPVYATNHGIGIDIDLGSNRFKRISKPVVAIVTNEGADFNAIGELWYLLDYRFNIPVSLIDINRLDKINLHTYNTIMLTEDFPFSKEVMSKLSNWAVHNTLIAIGGAYKTTNKLGLSEINLCPDGVINIPSVHGNFAGYAQKNNSAIPGVILNARMDLTHPVAFGMWKANIPLFKQGNIIISKSEDNFVSPISYSENPLLSGYIQPNLLDAVKNTPAVLSGNNVTYFVDNPYFRAIWSGSSRLLLNALFFRELLTD